MPWYAKDDCNVPVIGMRSPRQKSKPEILKHGGNGGKAEETEVFGLCRERESVDGARFIARRCTTPCFKVSGFDFCGAGYGIPIVGTLQSSLACQGIPIADGMDQSYEQ